MSGTTTQGTEAADAATVDQDYEAVLAAVNAVGKANSAIDADVVTDADEDEPKRAAAPADPEPADEGDDEDEEEEDEDLAKAAAPFMDASPLVGALIESNRLLRKGQRELRNELRAIRRDQGVMAKSNALLLVQNQTLRAEVEAIGNGGTGRRSVVQRPMGKSRPVVDENANPHDALFGPDLIGKATHASLHGGDHLSALELTVITEYAGMGATLGDIRESDPQLAGRFDAAMAALPKS